MSEAFDPEHDTGNEIVEQPQPRPHPTMAKDAVAEEIFCAISTASTFCRDDLKRLFPGLHERDFGLAFTAAIDRCRRELSRVYSPQSATQVGLYVLANGEQRLHRGRQQIGAANRKMLRAAETLAIRGPRRDVDLDRRRTRLLERAAFQTARRLVEPEEPLPEVVPVIRQRRQSIAPETTEYPRVPPRTRNRLR
jgi:hypothetical protein